MSAERLPNQEDLADLRTRGKVAVSSAACRLFAGLGFLTFLYFQKFDHVFARFYEEPAIEYRELVELLKKSGQNLQLALLLYLILFLVAAFIQSGFFFNVGKAFSRLEPYFDFSRPFRFLRAEIFMLLPLYLISFIALFFIWQRLISVSPELSVLDDPAQFLSAVKNMLNKPLAGGLLTVVALMPVLVVIRKVRFRFDNRAKVRR